MCKKIKSITTRDLSKSILSIPPLLEDALKLKTHQFFFTTIFLYFPCDIDYYFCVICGSLFPLNFKSTLQLSPLCKNVKKDRLKKSIRKVDQKHKNVLSCFNHKISLHTTNNICLPVFLSQSHINSQTLLKLCALI